MPSIILRKYISMLKNIVTCLNGWWCTLTSISFGLQQLSHCTCISMKYIYTKIVSHEYNIVGNINLHIDKAVVHRKKSTARHSYCSIKLQVNALGENYHIDFRMLGAGGEVSYGIREEFSSYSNVLNTFT